jgi:serine phosphatase RsbU (regulator of sigma subunit)
MALFVALIVTALAPLTYLGLTQIVLWREVQKRDADNELRLASTSLALAVGQVVDANVRAVTATAAQIGEQSSFDPPLLVSMLHRYREQFPACYGALVADADSQRIVSDPDTGGRGAIADRPYYQDMIASGSTSVSQVEMGRFIHVPTVHVCAPIRTPDKPGKLAGSVVAALSLQYLSQLTARLVDPFGETRALLLDSQGRVIADSARGGLAPLTDLSGVVPHRARVAGETVFAGGADEKGVAVRSASTPVAEQGLGWTVTVMRPQATIEEHARRARTHTLIAALGALLIGVVFAFAISSRLARPIDRLARYTRGIAEALYVTAPLPQRGDPREVSELTSTVTAMVAQLRKQADDLRAREAEQVVLGRLRRDLEIAERIQTGILPKRFDVPALSIGALMKQVEAVGGDYYDVMPSAAGCWVGVGDVSGHGLNSGLVMMMLQSALGSVAAYARDARPADLLKAVNRLLVENIRNRLNSDEHATLVLMHLGADGQFVLAGGHEPLVILRAGATRCEVVETSGPWMGINLEGAESLTESRGALAAGDLLVLHSDGVVEAGASRRNPFGIERLCAEVERLRDRPVQEICEGVVGAAQAWTPGPAEDDMTVVAVRYVGV